MDAERDDRSVIQPTVEATRPRSDTDRLAQTADQVFFIVGVGRSGTSLLQSMISSHPDAIIPNETKFYTVLRKRGRRFGDLRSPGTFEKAVDFTLAQWFIQGLRLPKDQFRRMCEMGARSWETIFMAILTLYAEKHGATRVGEKSPGHLSHIDHLQHSFPKARFIHIVRDPRAVVLSNLKAQFSTGYIGPTVRRWRGAVSIHRQWSDRLGPMRYHLVRYEDLVSEPEQTVRAVSAFLGLEFSCQMLSPENRPVAGFSPRQAAHMANTLKPVFTSSIDKWRSELTRRQVAMVEHAVSDEMRHLGYEPIGARTLLPGLWLKMGEVAQMCVSAGRKIRGRR